METPKPRDLKFKNGSSIRVGSKTERDDKLKGFDESFKLNAPAIQTVRTGIDGVPEAEAQAVIARANGQCEMCNRGPSSGVPLQISHNVARGMGGTHGEQSLVIHHRDNLTYLCEVCHLNLFHNQLVRYNPDTPDEQSCATCWLKAACHETAVLRRIIAE